MITLDERAQFNPDGVLYLLKKFDLGLRGLNSDGVFHIEIRSQFYIRYVVQFNTLINLVQGVKFELDGREAVSYDFYSVLGIARSLLETYLDFSYIYCSSRSHAEVEFRFKCWHLNGLLEQIKTINYIPNIRARRGSSISNTEAEIHRLSDELQRDAIFSELNAKQKEGILNGRSWRIRSRTEIAKDAGLNDTLINSYFSQTSSYIHSSSISLLQNYRKSQAIHRDTNSLAAQVAASIGIKLLSDLITLYPSAKLHFTEAELLEINMGAKQIGLQRQ